MGRASPLIRDFTARKRCRFSKSSPDTFLRKSIEGKARRELSRGKSIKRCRPPDKTGREGTEKETYIMNDQQSYAQKQEQANQNPYSAGNQFENAVFDQQARPPQAPPSNTLSIVSMVLGILAVVSICCCGASLPFGIAAIICAVVRKSKRGSMDGMAIAGLVMGIIGTVFGLIGALTMGSALVGFSNPLYGEILEDYFGMEYYLY